MKGQGPGEAHNPRWGWIPSCSADLWINKRSKRCNHHQLSDVDTLVRKLKLIPKHIQIEYHAAQIENFFEAYFEYLNIADL